MEDAETKQAVQAAMQEYGKAIIGDEARRAQECMQEVQKVLQKFDCVLVPRCMLSPQGAEFMIEAMPAPKQKPQPSTPYPGAPNYVPPTGAPDAVDKKG